jgi:hypothetical protein
MIVALLLSTLKLNAIELLTKEDALKRMFLIADNITEEKITLTPEQIESVKKLCGGKLYAIKKPDDAVENEYIFYIGSKGGKKLGYALIETQIDKWGPLKFIILINPNSGKIENAAMMEYVDSRSRYLSERSFLKTFFGKTVNDPIELNNDINAITGATVSTGVLCQIMKKTLAIYKVVYSK